MSIRLLAATLVASLSTAAFAEDGRENLREALGFLPESILSDPAPDLAYFVDLSVLAELAGEPLAASHLRRASVGAAMRPLETLYQGGTEEWSRKSGIDASEVRYLVGFGKPPANLVIWGLESEARAEALMEHLADGDFEPTSEAGPATVLANGPPMRADIAARDPADPWRGKLGQSSFVGARGNGILQAAAPQPVALIQQAAGAPSVAENLIMATALAAIEQGAGEAQIVQATLISPALGLDAVDPLAGFLSRPDDLDAIREELEAAMTDARPGIPPYLGGILADAQLGDKPALVISLTYPDCETAERAAEQVVLRWDEAMGERVATRARSEHRQGPREGCAALVALVAEEAASLQNPVFEAAYSAIIQRRFPVLQIGFGS